MQKKFDRSVFPMFTKNKNNNMGRFGTAKISLSSSVTTDIYGPFYLRQSIFSN